MTILKKVIDFIFPTRCFDCKTSNEIYCENCIAKIPPAITNMPSRYNSLYSYKHPPLKKALWELKYKNRMEVAKIFGRRLGEVIFADFSEDALFGNFKDPIIVPIPIYKSKAKKRGYNQSELIANSAKSSANINFPLVADSLYKVFDTEPQAKIKNKNKRLLNLKGSFSVRNIEKIKGKNIILIDDVTTTGASLNEARGVLLDAGARKVIGYTVAH